MRYPLAILPLADIKQSHFHDWITEALTNLKSSSVNRDLNLQRWSWKSNSLLSGFSARSRHDMPNHEERKYVQTTPPEFKTKVALAAAKGEYTLNPGWLNQDEQESTYRAGFGCSDKRDYLSVTMLYRRTQSL